MAQKYSRPNQRLDFSLAMRNREQDEQWIRDTVKELGIEDTVYITPNHYDGGYEVRIGSQDVFIEYPLVDAKDTAWIAKFKF